MKTTVKTITTLIAVLSFSLFASAEKQRGDGERQGKDGQKSCQECKKDSQDGDREGRRAAALERFDKNNDGELSGKEKARAKKASKKHRQNKAKSDEATV